MELSLAQKKLLKLLAINSRYSNKDLAESLGVSADTIQYQITKLVDEEQYGTFLCLFNQWMVGYEHYYYLARLKDLSKIPIAKLKALHFVTLIMRSFGRYDLQLFIITKDDFSLQQCLNRIQGVLFGNVQDYVVFKLMAELKWTHLLPVFDVPLKLPTNQKNSIYGLNKEDFSVGSNREHFVLDDTDKAIIKELLEAPRIPYLSIANKLSVSHETVRQRVMKFAESGFLMNIGLFPNYRKLGYFMNIIFLRLSSYDEQKFTLFAKSKKYITYAATLSGIYNCMIYTADKDPLEFSAHVKEIREHFTDEILDIEFLYFEKEEKNLQFPVELLDVPMKQ